MGCVLSWNRTQPTTLTASVSCDIVKKSASSSPELALSGHFSVRNSWEVMVQGQAESLRLELSLPDTLNEKACDGIDSAWTLI